MDGWTTHNVTTSADYAFSVFAIDLDNDGDIDLCSASINDDTIAWYENDGASPPSWTTHTVTTSADGARSVFAIDVDNDGDVDLCSVSINDDTIAWYESDGGSPPSWTTHTVVTSADRAYFVFAIDLDNDGDIDLCSASSNDDTLAWYENDGASPPSWTTHTVTTSADRARSVFAIDVDNDGDIDLCSLSFYAIAWYESDGGSPPSWTTHTVATSMYGNYGHSIVAIDVDNDGDIDLCSASAGDDTIAW